MNNKKMNRFLATLCMVLMLGISHTAQAQKVGRWEKLGERSVSMSVDKDVIQCSHKGTFTTLRFHVSKAPVTFLRVVVKYANGSTQNLKFNQLVRAGSNSPYIDLRGNRRIIKEVTMYYKTEPKRPGRHPKYKQAKVQVWGRH